MSRRKIDELDCVLMTAIQAVSENVQLEKETNAKEMEERLRSMILEIDEYLSH
jgi:cell division protein ZapA (FtsZ GTPase activity inhibitor)